MVAKYVVTFEFDTKPPVTLRGQVSGSAMPTLVARAARTAMRQAGRQTWSSVVVLIERTAESKLSHRERPIFVPPAGAV